MDACDEVMTRVAKPLGLIRFASEQELAGMPRRGGRPRLAVYGGLIGVFVALGAWTATQRSLLLVDVLRDRGSLAREATDGRIENAYTLKLANLAETPRDFEVEVSGLPGIELVGTRRFAGEAGSIRAVQVTVAAPADGGPSGARPITFQVRAADDPSTRVTEKSTFVLPDPPETAEITMYRYKQADQRLVEDRVAQFRDQMTRFLDGRLGEDEFRPLRLQNGLYVQRHAPMLRVAIPYGTLSSLRNCASWPILPVRWDRGYGHFTTRSNIQFNWVRLHDVPDILAALATAQMHAIQTSGNCIRNITCDQFAGVAADELFDPRPYCEIVRQWSTLAPEFLFLPRKFKIAFSRRRGRPGGGALP